MKALILGDNVFGNENSFGSIGRSTGSHRVATLLRKHNIETEVIDFLYEYEPEEIISILNLYNPKDLKMIGFSASLTEYHEYKTTPIIDYIKLNFPSTKIIVGGTNGFFKGISKADLYLEGFIENAILDLINFITDKPHNFPIEIFNLKTVVNCTKHYPLTDTANLETIYTASDFISPNETLVIEFSRGCIFKCKFCDFPLIGKNKNDYLRSEESLYTEFVRNYEQYGITKYIIADDTFNDNELKVDQLVNISNQLPFKLELMGFIRPDLMYSRKNSLDKIVSAGFKAMHFGIESFNPEASKSIGKAFNGTKLKNYLKEIKSNYPRLFLHGSFIVGLPYEDAESFSEGINWCNNSMLLDSWSIYNLTIPISNGFSHNSYFSNNWMMYGYEKKAQSGSKIIWKNKNFNDISARSFATKLGSKYFSNKKTNPWAAFATSGLGYNVDDCLSSKINLEDSKVRYQEFIQSYKIKKYNYIKSINK
jgi:radical SAM superfamily enzyme YgiQ (UPF0313 family)